MEAKVAILSLFVAIILAASASHADLIADQTNHIFMPKSGVDSHQSTISAGSNADVYCLSWRFNVEVDNIRKFKTTPKICRDYIADYITKSQYDLDTKVATGTAYKYAKTLALPKDLRNLWIFDIGQTALSFLEYYALPDVDFGAVEYNSTKFYEWYSNAIVPANAPVLKLYKKLVSLGFKIVFISGKKESEREVTEAHLRDAGYTVWEKVILKPNDEDIITAEFKAKIRTELVELGYRLWGNIGDQWADLDEPNGGKRIFKLPNPMFNS